MPRVATVEYILLLDATLLVLAQLLVPMLVLLPKVAGLLGPYVWVKAEKEIELIPRQRKEIRKIRIGRILKSIRYWRVCNLYKG